MTTPHEFGNDTACANCGDEWAGLDDKGLCPDCREVWEEANAQDEGSRTFLSMAERRRAEWLKQQGKE